MHWRKVLFISQGHRKVQVKHQGQQSAHAHSFKATQNHLSSNVLLLNYQYIQWYKTRCCSRVIFFFFSDIQCLDKCASKRVNKKWLWCAFEKMSFIGFEHVCIQTRCDHMMGHRWKNYLKKDHFFEIWASVIIILKRRYLICLLFRF